MTPELRVHRVILRKYDGDPPKDGEDKQPVETIELSEDGQIVSHTVCPSEKE